MSKLGLNMECLLLSSPGACINGGCLKFSSKYKKYTNDKVIYPKMVADSRENSNRMYMQR